MLPPNGSDTDQIDFDQTEAKFVARFDRNFNAGLQTLAIEMRAVCHAILFLQKV